MFDQGFLPKFKKKFSAEEFFLIFGIFFRIPKIPGLLKNPGDFSGLGFHPYR